MAPEQEDYVAGRLEFQSKAALKAKKVRSFIIAHPGCVGFDLAKQFGRPGYSSAVEWLLSRKLIEKRFVNDPEPHYYVVPL